LQIDPKLLKAIRDRVLSKLGIEGQLLDITKSIEQAAVEGNYLIKPEL